MFIVDRNLPRAIYVQQQTLNDLYQNRHFYLKIIKNQLKRESPGDIDLYISFVLREQKRIEEIEPYVNSFKV